MRVHAVSVGVWPLDRTVDRRALGRFAHDSLLTALGEKRSAHRVGHGAEHELTGGARLFDSYHCSRYNTNTGVLTTAMFEDVVGRAAAFVS